MGTIRCRCGAVEIELALSRDVFRLECCCYDCNTGLWYAHQRGGPPGPANQCIDTSWLANDFRIVKGEAAIGAFLNFKNADTTRFYCKQCWSVLFADHALYAGKVIACQAAAYDGITGLQRMPLQARHFVRDLSEAQRQALPPWGGDPANVYPGVADNLIARFPAMLEAGSEGIVMNARLLLERIGGAVVPDDAPRLSAGPPSLMQQLPAAG